MDIYCRQSKKTRTAEGESRAAIALPHKQPVKDKLSGHCVNSVKGKGSECRFSAARALAYSSPAPRARPSCPEQSTQIGRRQDSLILPLPYRCKRVELYAALDLGTNNCRLLIARPTKPGHFRVVDSYSHIVRLGEGLGHTGFLSKAAIKRTLVALDTCRSKLKSQKIAYQWLVTTEACRKAKNGPEFIRQVRHETGLELDIVDRETEARLAVSGCGALVDREAEAVILFDIGGGSSEIALLDVAGRSKSSRLAEHIIEWVSLPVGVVTLAEQFGALALTREGFARMKAYVDGLLADFAGKSCFRQLAKDKKIHFLGASGTVTMLAGLSLKLQRYNRSLIDGMWLGNRDIEHLLEILLNMDMEEKLANPCIGPGKADLILAGCAIMESIRALWPQADVRVADRGLREGILTELMMRQGAWRKYEMQNAKQAQQHKRAKG